jgi:hypothetical protein
MPKTFVIHDESLNSKGFWMLTAGCDLTQFRKNPIMLWNHNNSYGDSRQEKLPIGHWENIRIQGTQILADAVFDGDEFSQTIAQKVESGTLRMASVGANAIDKTANPKLVKPGQRYETVTKWVLKEASIVNIGANNNALALSDVVLYDEGSNIIELSDSGDCPLKELQQTQNSDNMNQVKKLLNLSDEATEQEVLNKLNPLLTLSEELEKEKQDKQALQTKLDEIELAEKEARTIDAKNQIAEAFKDGRLNADKEGKTEKFWLSAFESDYKLAAENLAALPKHKPISVQLGEDVPVTGGFAARQKEIENQNKNK